jgi:hypothetical protein
MHQQPVAAIDLVQRHQVGVAALPLARVEVGRVIRARAGATFTTVRASPSAARICAAIRASARRTSV